MYNPRCPRDLERIPKGGRHHHQGGRQHHQGGRHHHQGGATITKEVSIALPGMMIMMIFDATLEPAVRFDFLKRQNLSKSNF